MTEGNNTRLISLISKKEIVIISGSFVAIAFILSLLFIEMEAFEAFYEYTRSHESWELDELFLAFLAVLIALLISVALLSTILRRRLSKAIQNQRNIELQLMNSRKVQSMGSMLGGVAHSINNQLQPILILSQIIKDTHSGDDRTSADISRVLKAAKNASTILRKVLNFAHHQSESASRCELFSTLSCSVDLAETMIPVSISLDKDIPVTDCFVNVSPEDIEIIILNFISNAVDALEGEVGRISISLELKRCSDIQGAQGQESDRWACIKIADTGMGIEPEVVSRIFDPFYTNKPVGKGTGLGLSECFGIVSKADGRMDVDSRPNEGSCFMVYLPIEEKTESDIKDE